MYNLTPYARTIEPWAWWENGFTRDELDWLQNKAANSKQPAVVGAGTGNLNSNLRRSSISWLEHNDQSEWVFRKLSHIASSLNASYFNLDITGFGESLQLTNYNGSDNGMYGWHQDYNAIISRKLSLVLQLSDPKDYEGGDLQIFAGGTPNTVRKERGLVAAFPSYIMHQVTPVTRGTRQTLVAWVSGPAFK